VEHFLAAFDYPLSVKGSRWQIRWPEDASIDLALVGGFAQSGNQQSFVVAAFAIWT
jgi:hypothetical protein